MALLLFFIRSLTSIVQRGSRRHQRRQGNSLVLVHRSARSSAPCGGGPRELRLRLDDSRNPVQAVHNLRVHRWLRFRLTYRSKGSSAGSAHSRSRQATSAFPRPPGGCRRNCP